MAKVFNCYACRKEYPTAFGHQHHLIPQAAGGTDKDIVWLDSGCHAMAHSLAYMVMNPKRITELDQALTHFTDEDHRQKMAELANTVAQEMLAKSEGDKMGIVVKKKVLIELEETEHLRYLTMARDRRMSIVNFFIALARRESEKEL